MQSFKIINSRGDNIEFGMYSPYLLSHIEGLGIPTPDIYSSQSPALDGSQIHDVLLSDRIISVRATIKCESREELYYEKKRISKILNPKLGSLKLIYKNDYKTYREYGYIDGEIDFKERINNIGIVNMTFICPNPFWLDEVDIVSQLKYTRNNGFRFPAVFSTRFAAMSYRKKILNNGDIDIGCIIEYSGAAINPKIINETTGEFIKVNRTLVSGQKLVINTIEGEETVDIIAADGTKTNVFNWITNDSTFFKLRMGENILSYSSENETNADVIINVIYSNKYVGV